jgi:hypothetical protein
VVTLHQQQSDNFCKIHKEIAKWTLAVSYVWCFIVLSFVALCICVCCTAVRAGAACPLQRYWLLNPFTCPTVTHRVHQRQYTKLYWWQLAVWWYGWVSTTMAHFQNLNWTDIAWHSHFTTCVNNKSRYFAGLRQPPFPLALSTHFTPVTSSKRELGRNELSMRCNSVDLISAQTEKWNTVPIRRWGPSKEREGRYMSVYCSLSPHYHSVNKLSTLNR